MSALRVINKPDASTKEVIIKFVGKTSGGKYWDRVDQYEALTKKYISVTIDMMFCQPAQSCLTRVWPSLLSILVKIKYVMFLFSNH